MKNLIFLIWLFVSFSAVATEYIVVLSKDYPASLDKAKLTDKISDLVFNDLKQGDSLSVIADSQATLAEFKVPNEDGYDAKNVKKRLFFKPMKALKEIIQSLPQSETGTGLLHIPQILKFLSTQKLDTGTTERKVSVLLIGNALYVDDKEPAFSMKDGVFPSDGHIRATERFSIYGTSDKQGFLKGVSLHFLTTNPDSDWVSEIYQLRVKRFWQLFVKNQGGVLATFTPDLQTAFERFSSATNTPLENVDFDQTANKVEMLRIRRELAPVNESKEENKVADFLSDNVVLSTTPPAKNTGKIKLGIRWDCKECDIDLHARASNNNPYLFYGNSHTEEGIYFKDFTNSPDTVKGLEYVEFTKDIDITNIDAKINFYRGSVDKPITGEVRAEFDGKVYGKPFTIQATEGNSGGNDPKYWTVIDVKQLFGIQ